MKKNGMKLTFCKADLLAIALVAVIAVLVSVVFWTSVSSEEGSTLVVYQEGEMIRELPLKRTQNLWWKACIKTRSLSKTVKLLSKNLIVRELTVCTAERFGKRGAALYVCQTVWNFASRVHQK